MFEVKTAKREASPILAAFIGQSGSGKTLSALLMMRGIVGPDGKIVVIDTEGRRALIYADDPEVGGFDHIEFVSPFSSDRFREAVKVAVKSGADGIIIDSASHEHEAEGGMLDMADRYTGKNARGKWIKPKMAHGRFITEVKSIPVHVIFCIREKIIINVDVKPPVKVFLPVCDRDLPFEMALSIRLEPETHAATFVKVPKPFLPHVKSGDVITVEHGRLLMAEAGKGAPVNVEAKTTLMELTAAAENGWEALRTAYMAAWRENGPEDLKATTPVRSEMKLHSEQLKRIAADADNPENKKPAQNEPAPGDIGTVTVATAPDFDTVENGSDGMFETPDQKVRENTRPLTTLSPKTSLDNIEKDQADD